MSPESLDFFARVRQGLDDRHITYTINRRLVRGLDYYNHTAFEFITNELGAQGTVLAGGRYDNLMAQMGGPEIPGIGWALGLERVTLLMNPPPALPAPISLIPIGEDTFDFCFNLAMDLRQKGIPIDFLYSGNVAKRMKRANKINAVMAIMIGDDEMKNQTITLKDLETGNQTSVPLSKLTTYLLELEPIQKTFKLDERS